VDVTKAALALKIIKYVFVEVAHVLAQTVLKIFIILFLPKRFFILSKFS